MYPIPVSTRPVQPVWPAAKTAFAVIGTILVGTGSVYGLDRTESWRHHIQPRVPFIQARQLLRKEHARAARIVREVVKHAAHMERQTKVNREANAYWQGKLDGAENILAALTKGRV